MPEVTFWFKRTFFLLIHCLLRNILAVFYWGKKRTVPPIKNDLLLKSANTLAKEIREGKLKSEDVIQAYVHRIKEVEPYINAVVKDNFNGALDEARKVDELIESKQITIEKLSQEMPLLGVPFTVKCLLSVKGFPHTAASLLFKDRIADEDAATVALLKEAGGIFLALTNSPEFGSSIQTTNRLYGTTCNPYDTTRIPGGSSGGESALLGAAGSLIGIGNDLLGSVRIPAHFCGLFSHKPSPETISNEGTFPRPHPAVEYATATGPMCRYSEDLNTMMNILTGNKGCNLPMEKVNFARLKIYFQTTVEHAFVASTEEEIVQAVKKAATYFKQTYGIETQEVKLPLLNKVNGIVTHVMQTQVPNMTEHLTDGKIKHVNGIFELLKYIFGKSLLTLSLIISLGFGRSFPFFDSRHVPVYKNHCKALSQEFDELLDDDSLFLYPTFPTTAPYITETYALLPSTCYTSVFNCIGLPSTQCPMGMGKNGMPLGIQIVSRKKNDKLALACAAELEKVFGGWLPP